MPTLNVVNFNIVCATLGGFITLFGLVSYLLKEKFYLSEALISTIFGVIFSPHATNFIKPLDYANSNQADLETITLSFTRLVLGVQLVLAGVQLPSKYLKKEWKSLSILLGPGMCVMWITTSLLVWAMVPDISFLFALAVGASVTPTDPVLSNGIVKGKFADKNIPPALQKIIIAESGANDGLGYPFLFFALYLIKYTGDHGLGQSGGARTAMGLWFGETWGYTIILSVAYGVVVGWLAKELLHRAEERRYVDRESFLVFAITLALFIVGTAGMLGSDDVLACFIAGNVFTWDDWFRLETMDDSLQPTIDMLLNVSIFMWFGAVCPWHKFLVNDVIPIYRLALLGILVLLLRRLPMVLGFHKFIHQIEHLQHASFVGFFGPIGVSAIFYLYISREFLLTIAVDGQEREDAARLGEVMDVVIWFLVVCSITVHGLSIPLGKLGFYIPRTISTAISSERVSAQQSMARQDPDEPEPLHIGQHVENEERRMFRAFHRRLTPSTHGAPSTASSKSLLPRSLLRTGKHILNDIARPHGTTTHGKDGVQGQSHNASKDKGSDSSGSGGNDDRGVHPEISAPRDARRIKRPIHDDSATADGLVEAGDTRAPAVGTESPSQSSLQIATRSGEGTPTGQPSVGWHRSIRFPDEPLPATQLKPEKPVDESTRDASPPDFEGAVGS